MPVEAGIVPIAAERRPPLPGAGARHGVSLDLPLPPAVLLSLGIGLGATALLPAGAATLAALAAVILLGIPHGALDSEVARPLLRPRFGWAWFAAFAIPYLALSAAVLLAWRAAPEAVLAAFLVASVLHFGLEDAGSGRPMEALARGGLPVAVPVLVRPAAVADFFGMVTLTPMPVVPPWLAAGATAWLLFLPLAVAAMLRSRRWGAVGETALLSLSFAVLPPPTAFALYFVGLHAPRHMAALAADPVRAPRVRNVADAVRRSLPVTGLTLLLGAALWPLFPGPPAERLLAMTLQGLAALTLPHLLLHFVASEDADAARRRTHTPWAR